MSEPTLHKEQAARLLEYLDRCPLGGPGTAGMHRERLEMNSLCETLVALINYEPPTATEENPDERTEDDASGEA